MQHVVPNNVASCFVEMLRAFGQAFKEARTSFIASKDALIRRIGTTTLYYVLAILWYQMKHELLLKKIQPLL